MSFFIRYGYTWYNYDPNFSPIALNDITKAVAIDRRFSIDPNLTLSYQIQDRDRPELISNRLYGTVEYWWTVLLINQIIDYDSQWPMNESQLETFISVKYPLNNITDIHHYETIDGIITDPQSYMAIYNLPTEENAISFASLVPITIYNYESKVNQIKRNIKLVDPDYISIIDNQMIVQFK